MPRTGPATIARGSNTIIPVSGLVGDMAEGERVSTREWLDPPGQLRRYRWLVGGLVLVSVVVTPVLWFVSTDTLAPFLAGMVAIGVLSVVYLVIWAVNLVAFYTDPEEW